MAIDMRTVDIRFPTLRRQMHLSINDKTRLSLLVFVLSNHPFDTSKPHEEATVILNGPSHPQNDEMEFNQSSNETCRKNIKQLH